MNFNYKFFGILSFASLVVGFDHPMIALANRDQIQPYFNPNCPDLDLMVKCTDACSEDYYTCKEACGEDERCQYECTIQMISCQDACPCANGKCYQGCEGCENKVCSCKHLDTNEDYKQCMSDIGDVFSACMLSCDNMDNPNEVSSCERVCTKEWKFSQIRCPCQQYCPIGCPCSEYHCGNQESTTSSSITTASAIPTTSTTSTTAAMTTTTVTTAETSTVSTTTTATTTMTTSTTTIQTTSPVKNELVLVLSKYYSDWKDPVLLNNKGEYTEDVDFEYEDNTDLNHACSVEFQNKLYVFGGYYEQKQMSIVEDCKLKRQSDLPFNWYYGSCGVFNFNQGRGEEVLLCFDQTNSTTSKICETYNGTTFEQLPVETEYGHSRASNSLGQYRGGALTVGGCHYSGDSWSWHSEVESLEFEIGRLKWKLKPKYPYYSSIGFTALVSFGGRVMVFGGNSYEKTVAQFENDQWTKLGDLLQSRYGHNAILFDGDILIVGGLGSKSTEIWNIQNKTSTAMEPTLDYYYYYPALLNVPFDYCMPN